MNNYVSGDQVNMLVALKKTLDEVFSLPPSAGEADNAFPMSRVLNRDCTYEGKTHQPGRLSFECFKLCQCSN